MPNLGDDARLYTSIGGYPHMRTTVGGASSSDYFIEVARGNVPGASLVKKFGRNPSIGTSTPETIWEAGGDYVFPSAAETVELVSDSANDTLLGTGAQIVTVQGLDANYMAIEEDVNMNGLTIVTTTKSYLRVNRAFVKTAGALEGCDGVITGANSTSSQSLLQISVGVNQSQLGVYTVPAAMTALVEHIRCTASKAADAAALFEFMQRPFGGVFRLSGTYGSGTRAGANDSEEKLPYVFQEKTDLKWTAAVTSNATQCAVAFDMILFDD